MRLVWPANDDEPQNKLNRMAEIEADLAKTDSILAEDEPDLPVAPDAATIPDGPAPGVSKAA